MDLTESLLDLIKSFSSGGGGVGETGDSRAVPSGN